jgi:ribonuclease HII
MRRAGIDEAGYGPILGPLSIARASAEVHEADALAPQLATVGVDDSKALHNPGNLGKLERVALGAIAWLTGAVPKSAAEVFSLMGESPAEREALPWATGADSLLLPVSAKDVPPWSIPSATPLGLHGALIHPEALNRNAAAQRNRAVVEWDAIGSLIADFAGGGPSSIAVDRLGGRRYYSDPLASVFPLQPITVIDESTTAVSRYAIDTTAGGAEVAFLVGGERADPLIAVASCVAKYARELHLALFNRWWGRRQPGLRPTAGYGTDAHRWMRDIPPADLATYRWSLVRGASAD